jgi:hypothetical protein
MVHVLATENPPASQRSAAGPVLLLLSTPWHVFAGLGLLFGPYRHRRVDIVLIDQPRGRESPWWPVLNTLPGVRVSQLPAVGKQAWDKLLHLRSVLMRIETIVDALRPVEIVCGNDRRVEFQYAMRRCARRGAPARGLYLDDGSFSYSGRICARPQHFGALRQAVEWLGDRLALMPWREHPRPLGTSRWVDGAWLAFPAHAHAALRNKPCEALEPAWYRGPQMLAVCAQLLAAQGFDMRLLCGIDTLVLFPHDHLLRASAALRERYARIIAQELSAGRRVAVKRHPRSLSREVGWEWASVLELPAALPLEVLAPQISAGRVYSALSTVLVNLRWLRPDIEVYALGGASASSDPLSQLYPRIGVRPAPAI